MNYDNKAIEDIAKSEKAIFFWILVASYGYYIRNDSILSDEYFDSLCKYVYNHFDRLEHSHYKKLFNKESMVSGSMNHLKYDDYHWYVIKRGEEMIREISMNISQNIKTRGE